LFVKKFADLPKEYFSTRSRSQICHPKQKFLQTTKNSFPEADKIMSFSKQRNFRKTFEETLFYYRKNKKIQENSNLNILSIERKSGKS
jgi:hypothetical protein